MFSSQFRGSRLAFADPHTPVATAIDIKAAYDAKCGAPSAGAPKVFFKYFYVNTATGEKPSERVRRGFLMAVSGKMINLRSINRNLPQHYNGTIIYTVLDVLPASCRLRQR